MMFLVKAAIALTVLLFRNHVGVHGCEGNDHDIQLLEKHHDDLHGEQGQQRNRVLATSPVTRSLSGVTRCGTDIPSLANRESIASALRSFDESNKGAFRAVIIPTWFHIIYDSNGNGQVTRRQIRAQMSLLNTAFASTGIKFKRTGTTNTTNDAWFQDNSPATVTEMKTALHRGGANTLNVWTTACSTSGLLGFATWPSNYVAYPLEDGVVIDYGSVPSGYLTDYNLGATLIHEVGHWLGLYHVFEGGCSEVNDEVADTPAQLATADCPSSKDSCLDFPGEDSFHNYMDYSLDACMYEITPGQSSRMQSMWGLYRQP